jgi:hypothetical protein
MEAAGEGHTTKMDPRTLLYLFEFYKTKIIGGPNSPYACAEWLGFQIPQAIMSVLESKGLQFTFFDDKREGEDHNLHFYERNPAGEGWISTTTRRIRPTSSGMQLNSAA